MIATGSRVAFSVQFLYSIGEAPLGESCHYRGTVVEISKCDIATVAWDHCETAKVHIGNLANIGPNHHFCNCGIGLEWMTDLKPQKRKNKSTPEAPTKQAKRWQTPASGSFFS